MPLLLHIDSAVEGASVCLSEGAQVIAFAAHNDQRESAAWLQAAIRDLFAQQGYALRSLAAISVSSGPGSYTGLRVGMASAKGLCYALGIPLITIPTLAMMAAAAPPSENFLCPMIDARRLEVFAAAYTPQLQEVLPRAAVILDSESFFDLLQRGAVTFFGNGSNKFQAITQHPSAGFAAIAADARNLAGLAARAFQAGDFADLAYAEPDYGKEFYTPASPRNS